MGTEFGAKKLEIYHSYCHNRMWLESLTREIGKSRYCKRGRVRRETKEEGTLIE